MTPLDIATFHEIHRQKRAQRSKLFELDPPDDPASDEQIADLEAKLGVRLPRTYVSFLKDFGGGSFGLTNVFSAARQSEYYSVLRNTAARELIPENSIAFSDDYCGGWYILCISDHTAMEPVFYWNADSGTEKTKFANMLEYVAAFAYDSK